jgi:alkanesulfonate monooxygenase SsuD/methylene tetrahydromethanopterin reductase-like flavin-dependent oxidoreductase (luciferase family)
MVVPLVLPSARARNLAELCRRAEATGADSLWAVDHLFWPHPINECLTTLAIAASATRRPMLGSCVLQLPLRQPAAVAKQATALQNLSGGRFVLGVGVGSHETEYARAGFDFHRRGQLMDEGIAAMGRAWASVDEPPAPYRQEPSSPRVPLWIGGSSPAARRRAAAVGDGWVPLFLTADDYGSGPQRAPHARPRKPVVIPTRSSRGWWCSPVWAR